MKILKINNNKPDVNIIRRAADSLRQGKIIIHPTETVYGFAVDYTNVSGIRKCSRLKKRIINQPYSIMVNNVRQIIQIGKIVDKNLIKFLKKILPGPITILIPRQKKLPIPFWNQFLFLGFRLPDHSVSKKLTAMLRKPIITTSVNYTGEPAAIKVDDIPTEIIKKVDLVLDGGETEEKIPSTIIKMEYDPLTLILIRNGAFPWIKIKEYFEKIHFEY
jgi:L-threonylcarbamoyladenylate synthase